MPAGLLPKKTEAQREAEEIERAERATAKGSAPTAPAPRLATDYVHATHPDTGNPVVFVPGEALPDWATSEE